MKIIAATASPRRHAILRRLGVAFEVDAPEVEEIHDAADPVGTVVHNARAKYAAVQKRHPGAAVLAADTLVWFEGELIGKPRDLDEAKKILRRLSGRTHVVFTAVATGASAGPEVRVEASSVRFRELGEDKIAAYVAEVRPLDRAGAYDIDENGGRLVAGWSGSYTNIMGLPEEVVRGWLGKTRGAEWHL